MKLEFVERKTKEMDGKFFVATSYSIGGYALKVLEISYADGTGRTEFTFRPIEENRFLPEIYFRGAWGEDDPAFEIQTTSYGALEAGEFRKFLAAQQRALEVVDVVTREFLENEEG